MTATHVLPQDVNSFALLLVEDSIADAAMVHEMLPTGDFSLQHVTSLAAARAYISQNPVTVVLLDLSLPDGCGLNSFLSMLALAPDTPIIVLTGSADDISVQAVRNGAQDYLLKGTLTPDTLIQSIRYAIERKKAEEVKLSSAMRAKEIEAGYKLAMIASRTGIWSYHLASGCITTDEQIARIWGVEPGTFGDNFPDFLDRVYVEDRDTVLQAIEAAIDDKCEYEFEHRIIWPDGRVHHILAKGSVYSDDTGTPARMTGVCVDITNRKRVEERLKLALKGSRIGTWVREIESGRLIWDDQAHALFGLRPGDFSLLFEDFLKMIVPADVDEMLALTNAAIENGSEYHSEFRIVWPDGTVHYIESRGLAYHDSPLRLAGVCIDITDRKLSEQGRLQLAAIVESSDDGIISKTLDGVILSWNRGAERIFGFSADQMIGRSISELMPSGPDELHMMLEKLELGESIEHYESTRLRQDGRVIDVSLTLSPIRDAFGTVSGACAIVRDITNRKRLERLSYAQNEVTRILSESQSFVAAAPRIVRLIAKTNDCDFGAIWCLDPDYMDLDEKLLRCVDVWHESDPNLTELAAVSQHVTFPAGNNFLGSVLNSGNPSWIPDLITDGNFPRLDAAVKGGLRTAVGFPILVGAKVLGVMEFLSRQGEEPDHLLLEMMAIIGAQIGQFIDRSHAEEAARRSARARLTIGQAIMENAPIGVVWLDKNLVVSEANNEFALQFGLDRKHLLGISINQIPTGIPVAWLDDVIQEGNPYSSNNFRVTLSGSQGPRDAVCDLTIWPVKNEEERPIGLILLTVEVTERVKLAKQREDFVATLTHDLKNPLIGQDRMLGMILEGHLGPLNADQAEMLSLFKTGTQDMLQLIGTLLEVYRYEDGTPHLLFEQLDARQLISRCIAQLSPIAQAKRVSITSFFPEPLAAVRADQIALKRVLMNLLDNAIKFTPAGGLVQVSCQSTDTDFMITIEDSGIGISEQELKSLFQRFAQTGSGKKHKAGTGLGLYLCRQIVEAHGGKITCTSQEGKATVVSVKIPAVQSDQAQAAESQAAHR